MQEQSRGVVTQNLLDFTVQIRRIDTDAIVGTGVIISLDGKIITCAHVIAAALGENWRGKSDADIGIYFPQAQNEESKSRSARLSCWFLDTDDDIVVLQLQGDPPPLAPKQIAVVGTAEQSLDHSFRSYGFRSLPPFMAGRANGIIQGPVAAKQNTTVHVLPVQLDSNQINSGMSGSPVLDLERNLVVGLVSDVWIPDASMKDLNTAWAVDAQALSLQPFNLPVRTEALPLHAAPRPNTDVLSARLATDVDPGVSFNGAPTLQEQWAGREDLLNALDADWSNPDRRCTLLVGFAGQGKTSLVRQWVDNLQQNSLLARPEGILWWTFYNKRTVDSFFDTALSFLSAGALDPRKLPSANVKAQVLGAMLGARRYLFVLDGLEVVQHQKGDSYGCLINDDLREFLKLFAAPDQESFCLITSRLPPLDLIMFTTCFLRPVEALNAQDGRTLLRRWGVVGSNKALEKVVADWDGHALTLALLASYLVQRYKGDVQYVSTIPEPSSEEPHYQRVNHILHEYDSLMSETEITLLMFISAFRRSVHEVAFEHVLHYPGQTDVFYETLSALNADQLQALLQRLITYNILSDRERVGYYTLHALVRAYYYGRLQKAQLATTAHARIKDYYLNIAANVPEHPTIDDLSPFIEAVYHACKADAFDEAYQIYQQRLDQGHAALLYELGAYETNLTLLLEFFPDEDYRQEPCLENVGAQIELLRSTSVCLMTVGRLQEALQVSNRNLETAFTTQNWFDAGKAHQLRAELYIHQGELIASREDASAAIKLYDQARNTWNATSTIHSHGWGVLNLSLGPDEQTICSLAYQAWANYLLGENMIAHDLFEHAQQILQKKYPELSYLPDLWGIYYADYLKFTGNTALAREVAEANLRYGQDYGVTEIISQSHRVLGDLNAQEGRHNRAGEQYANAVKVARNITHRAALLEALTARGSWSARQGVVDTARDDLDEAFSSIVSCGYRVLEVQVRIGQGWYHLAAGNNQMAQAEVLNSLRMSNQMNCHLGKEAAQELLDIVGTRV